MSNNPMLHYKPGLTMDTPVTVTMAAADWACMMTWFTGLDDETRNGVSHLIYTVISGQVAEALYSKASIKATQTAFHEQMSQHPVMRFMQTLGIPDGIQPEDFATNDVIWVVRCAVCDSADEYPPNPTGELTCGHNGTREVMEIKLRPTKGE